MLVVHTTIPVDRSNEAAFLERVGDLVERSRTADGTVRYRAMRDLTDRHLIRFVEQYEDAAAAESHMESEEYRRFVEALPEVVEDKIETVQYEVDDVVATEFTAEEAVAALD